MSGSVAPPDITDRSNVRRYSESVIGGVLFLCAALSVVVTVAIVLALLGDALRFFTEVSPVEFFTGTTWSPNLVVDGQNRYGVIPLVTGTLAIMLGAAAVALPTGLLSAIYLSEYASESVRSRVKPGLEILAGIPTVVYGYFALVYITPLLRGFVPVSTFNVISASIVVGIMIIPMVSSISEDAMSAVPDSLREAGYGLGATKFRVSTSIVVPAAASGIVSSFILALSRAIGETMAVTIAAGQNPQLITPANLPDSLLGPIETMTAAMVNLGLSDSAGNSTQYRSLFAIGLTLFAITLAMNLVSQWVASRYREVYE
jgi:phosphate transport system permease protein